MEARQSLSRRNSHASQLDTQAQVPGFSDGANVRNLNFYKGLFLARVPCALCRTVQPSHCQRAAKCADRARKEPTPATARGRKVGVEGGARARNTGSPLEPAFPPIDSHLQHPLFSRCPRPPTPPPSTLPLPSVSTAPTPTPHGSQACADLPLRASWGPGAHVSRAFTGAAGRSHQGNPDPLFA
jgi:hypothetical protein